MLKKNKRAKPHPLLSWDIIAMQRLNAAHRRKLDPLFQLKTERGWHINLDEFIWKRFDTIVVTDVHEVIVWASQGFQKMTGYPTSFAIGKRPSFLQGTETSPAVKATIRQSLTEARPVSGELINYRKDQTPYLCAIHIIPLFNEHQELMNFMALEKEVPEKIV